MKKKVVVLVTVACIMLLPVGIAYAETANLRYVAISTLECGLSISSGKATCIAYVASSSASHSASIFAALKRSSNGSSWTTVKTWSASGSGLLGATIDESVTVSSGYKYKLFVTATIKNAYGILIETAHKNSQVVEY